MYTKDFIANLGSVLTVWLSHWNEINMQYYNHLYLIDGIFGIEILKSFKPKYQNKLFINILV